MPICPLSIAPLNVIQTKYIHTAKQAQPFKTVWNVTNNLGKSYTS